MKLLLKQYLSSLNERGELDVVLPDILSEAGYTVISRPKRGTTQYGVDVAATGPHPRTGKRALFLLSIKSGDLSRSDWDTGQQALRPSLNEILDVYIPQRIAKPHQDLPIFIALCFGGDIDENVRPNVKEFIEKNTKPNKIEFLEWNGDFIAELIATGLLREKLFSKDVQAAFRKSVAFVDEPEVCLNYFTQFLNELARKAPKHRRERLRFSRQIHIATWTVFVWCRDIENLEAAYRCSALACLWIWHISHPGFEGRSRAAKDLMDVTNKAISLHRIVATSFIAEHVNPYAEVPDGLAVSVHSPASVDINLALFEVIGRVAIHGLWIVYNRSITNQQDSAMLQKIDEELQKIADLIVLLIENNPALFTPLRDDHAIEINLSCIFLQICGRGDFIHRWVEQTTLSSIFSHKSGGTYPCILRDYSELARHPQSTPGYQEEVTVGGVLYPTLGIWLGMVQDDHVFSHLSEFRTQLMPESTWQFWLPDETTDEHLYRNTATHGACFSGLNTAAGSQKYMDQVLAEIRASPSIYELSAMRRGVWPLVLLACQVHRLPIPPHFWVINLAGESDEVSNESEIDQS